MSKESQKRMRDVVARFQEYVKTYTEQPHWAGYSERMFTDDMIYGVGIALQPEQWRTAEGFEEFKAMLVESYLTIPKLTGAPR